jgi:hypothetical protein
LKLFQLLAGVLDRSLQPRFMFLGLFQGEGLLFGYCAHRGAGQEVSFYFSAVGMTTNGTHNHDLLALG